MHKFLRIFCFYTLSIHVNTAGNGSQWMNARGWCAYTFPGHTESDDIADCLYLAAEKNLPGQKIRTDYSDGVPSASSKRVIPVSGSMWLER